MIEKNTNNLTDQDDQTAIELFEKQKIVVSGSDVIDIPAGKINLKSYIIDNRLAIHFANYFVRNKKAKFLDKGKKDGKNI